MKRLGMLLVMASLACSASDRERLAWETVRALTKVLAREVTLSEVDAGTGADVSSGAPRDASPSAASDAPGDGGVE